MNALAAHDRVESRDPYPFAGRPDLQPAIERALRRVTDPEVSMSIVDVGLVYGVQVDERQVHVLVTMTSAACP